MTSQLATNRTQGSGRTGGGLGQDDSYGGSGRAGGADDLVRPCLPSTES